MEISDWVLGKVAVSGLGVGKSMQLSQTLHTSGESSEPALLTWRTASYAGQSITSARKGVLGFRVNALAPGHCSESVAVVWFKLQSSKP